MLPAVVFPDAELVVTGFLRTALAGRSEPYAASVFVGITVPDPRRDRMVIVRRDGGPRLDTVRESARIAVNVWATSEQDAADLSRLVRALMWAAPDGDPVCRVSDLSGPSSVADPSGQPRRFMTFELIVRGGPLP